MATPPKIALTPQDVERIFAALEEGLATHNTEPVLLRLMNAERAFQLLEAQWRVDPAVLRPFVSGLKRLRESLSGLRIQAIPELVNALAMTKETIEHAKRQEAVLRAALVRYFRETGEAKPAGSFCHASISSRVARRVPAPSSFDRVQLEALLKERGLWERVVSLSAPKLASALAELDEMTRQAFDAFCPQYETHTVFVRGVQTRTAADSPIEALEGFEKTESPTISDFQYLLDRLGRISPDLREEAEAKLLQSADELVSETLAEIREDRRKAPRSRWSDVDAIYREYGGDRDAWGQSPEFD